MLFKLQKNGFKNNVLLFFISLKMQLFDSKVKNTPNIEGTQVIYKL